MVVPKNCEPELSYILAELFNKCLKESCFPDCWKISSVVPVFKNLFLIFESYKLLGISNFYQDEICVLRDRQGSKKHL